MLGGRHLSGGRASADKLRRDHNLLDHAWVWGLSQVQDMIICLLCRTQRLWRSKPQLLEKALVLSWFALYIWGSKQYYHQN